MQSPALRRGPVDRLSFGFDTTGSARRRGPARLRRTLALDLLEGLSVSAHGIP